MSFVNLIRSLELKVERQRKALAESEALLEATKSLAAQVASQAPVKR